jgi:two-component system sensor histidine kinase HydH
VTGILSDRQRIAADSLRRSERLKTLGEMAAGMAHEVKNPLAAIRSSAQILAGRAESRDAELAGIVVSEVDRLNRVVNEFLEYARPAPLKRQPVKLSALLDSCLELLAPVIGEKSVQVSRRYPPDEANVSADAGQLRQVFLNLLLNAIQALDSGCCVEIAVEQSGRQALVRVRDNGRGVDPGDLKRIFRPFFTTKPGGTGLGLPIAQRIVAEHGGRLTIESTPGAGTIAAVSLPL